MSDFGLLPPEYRDNDLTEKGDATYETPFIDPHLSIDADSPFGTFLTTMSHTASIAHRMWQRFVKIAMSDCMKDAPAVRGALNEVPQNLRTGTDDISIVELLKYMSQVQKLAEAICAQRKSNKPSEKLMKMLHGLQ